MAKPTTIDEYLDSTPAAGRPLLGQLRPLCRTAAPAALEQIKWGYPA